MEIGISICIMAFGFICGVVAMCLVVDKYNRHDDDDEYDER